MCVYNVGTITGNNAAGAVVGRNNGRISASYWLDSTASQAIGLAESGASAVSVKCKLAELTGADPLLTVSATKNVAQLLNEAAGSTVWAYDSSFKYPGLVDLSR
jgi:hypothetical protein